jgi:hypothetical protein
VTVRNAANKQSVGARLDVSCSDVTLCLPTFRRNSVLSYPVSEGPTLKRNGSTKAHTTTVCRIAEHFSSQTFCYCGMPSFDCAPHFDELEELTAREVTLALRLFDFRNC